MKKKLSMLLTLALATTLGASTALASPPDRNDRPDGYVVLKSNFKTSVKFKDVGNADWALRFITEMNIKNVISGYEDGNFRPSNNVSQQEAVIMVIRTMGLTDTAKALDTKVAEELTTGINVSAWARPYVAIALQKGFLVKADLAKPQEHADREWVTELVVRAMGLQAEADQHMNDTLTFKDSNKISADAVGYIAVASEKGIINGYLDKTFQPHKPVKRNEMATILANAEHFFEYDADRQQQTAGQLFGTLKSAASTGLTVTTPAKQDVTYKFATQNYVFVDGKMGTFSDLKAGMAIRVLVNTQNEIVFAEAKSKAPKREEIETRSHGTLLQFTAPQGSEAGTITLVNTVHGKTNKKLTLPVAPDAVITVNGQTKTFSDLTIGDFATVTILNNTIVDMDVIPALIKEPDVVAE